MEVGMVRTSADSSTVPAAIEPMLATPDGGRLPDGPGFAYEFKWDFCTRFHPVADQCH
jgi:hypothetical protein